MKSICTLLFLALFFAADAQQSLTDTAFYTQSINNALAAYKKQVQDNLHIFNGIEYLRSSHGVKGTPFLKLTAFYPGRFFMMAGCMKISPCITM